MPEIKLTDLEKQRGELVKERDGLLKLDIDEMTDDQVARLDELVDEIAEVDTKISKREKINKLRADQAEEQKETKRRDENRAIGVQDPDTPDGEAKEIAKITPTFRELILAAKSKGPAKGAIAEINEEAQREAARIGIPLSDGGQSISVPLKFINQRSVEKRDISVGSGGPAAVATQLGQFIPALQAKLVFTELGAQFLTGLTSNMDWPRFDTETSTTWNSETGAGNEVSPTLEKLSMSPKRQEAFIDISKQLIIQSSPDIETILVNDLVAKVAQKITNVAINGGGSNEPTGILADTDVPNFEAGSSDGGNLKYAEVLAIMKTLENNLGDGDAARFLTNPDVFFYLMGQDVDSGSGLKVAQMLQAIRTIVGKMCAVTTLVPNTFTKGGGSNLSGLVYGNFADLIIGQWGGLDIVYDPYTQATSGLDRIVLNVYQDVGVRRPNSFVRVDDINVSLDS